MHFHAQERPRLYNGGASGKGDNFKVQPAHSDNCFSRVKVSQVGCRTKAA